MKKKTTITGMPKEAERCQPGEHVWREEVFANEYEPLLAVWISHHRRKTCKRCGEIRWSVDKIHELQNAIDVAIAESSRPLGVIELRHIRSVLQWRPADLADKIGVSRGTVSRWESGDVAIPAYAQIAIKLIVLLRYGRPDREVRVDGPREPIALRLAAGQWITDDFESLGVSLSTQRASA